MDDSDFMSVSVSEEKVKRCEKSPNWADKSYCMKQMKKKI